MKQPPEEFEFVLAQINRITESGIKTWPEVVYYDVWDKRWYSYHGSDTFDVAGDTVVDWVYCNEVFKEKL